MTRAKSLVLVLVFVAALTSCSKSHSVWIANSCDRPLTVRTFDIPPDEIEGEDPNEQATIPAASSEEISSAFSDAAGSDWSIQIEESNTVYPVSKGQLPNDTFVVPAEVCATT